jgi:hypothetical protein
MPGDEYFEAQYAEQVPFHVRLAALVRVPPNRVFPPDGPRQAYRVAIPGLKKADGKPALSPVYLGELTPQQKAFYDQHMRKKILGEEG